MLSTTSRPLVGGMACRRLSNALPARRLSHLTMGFNEIAAWKEENREASNPSTGKAPTIFDLKANNPINKSSTWNIDYAPEAKSKPEVAYCDQHWLFQMTRARMLSPKLAIRRDVRAHAESSAVRIPSGISTYSSLATNIPSTTSQESVFGSARRADEITDVPDISVLTRLHPEADEMPAADNASEQPEEPNKKAPGSPENQSNNEGGDDTPSSIRKEHLQLYDSMIGCPPWFP